MFCSSCGVAVAQGLSYCNYCGAKLNRGDATSSEVRPEFLIAAMVGLFIFGLLAVGVLMGVMKNAMGLPVERVLAFTSLPFFMFLILEGILIRLLLRRGGSHGGASHIQQGKPTKELDAGDARGLPPAKPSVTEHTTRAFDPIYTDRK